MLMMAIPENQRPEGGSLLLEAEAVALLTGLSERTVYRWSSAVPPLMPRPIGPRSTQKRWRRADIVLWVECGMNMNLYRQAKKGEI